MLFIVVGVITVVGIGLLLSNIVLPLSQSLER